MKPRIIFTACLAALAIGLGLGFSVSPEGSEATRKAVLPSASPAVQGVKALPAAGVQPEGFSRDERIMRVFSSLQQRVELLRKYELFEALQGLTAKDMAALVKHVESLKKAASEELLPALIERWFELDVAGAAEWAKASEKLDYRMFEPWTKADPEGAIRVALSSAKKGYSPVLIYKSLEVLYGKDYATMLARVQTLPVGELRDRVVNLVLQWCEQEPAAFAAFEKITFSSKHENLRDNLLGNVAKRDPAWALAKLGELLPTLKAGVLGNELVGSTAATVARKDPRQALDWLSGLPEEFRTAPAIRIAREWANKEPIAALEWCVANGVEITRADWQGTDSWQPSVLGGIMGKAPTETFAALAALPAGAERDSLLECAFMESLWHTPSKQLYADGDAMAWGFYKALPEDAQVVKAYLFGQKRALFGAVDDVGAWAHDFAPGLARSNAIAGAMSGTQQRAPAQVEEQLGKLNAGADRDAALRGIATSQPAPAGAARAMGIADETVRRDTLEKIVPRWLKSDEPAGRAWLQSAAIPDAWRKEWLGQSAAQ